MNMFPYMFQRCIKGHRTTDCFYSPFLITPSHITPLWNILWTGVRHAGEQIERPQAQEGGEGGIRRGLGPGGTRGTIELLCRGGRGIAAPEVPTVVGYKILKIPLHSDVEPLFFLVETGGPLRTVNRLK